MGEPERQILDSHRRNAKRPNPPQSNKLAPPVGKSKDNLGLLSADYVNEPILDVLRAIGTAYSLSIIPDPTLADIKVTIHLEKIPVLEGLERLCRSHGLDILQEGQVYRVQRTKEAVLSSMEFRNGKMFLDLKNKPVRDFLREFGEKAGINIVPDQTLEGTISGSLRNVSPVDGLKALIDANGFTLRQKSGVYVVEAQGTATESGSAFPRSQRRTQRMSANSGEIDLREGRITLSLRDAPLGDAIREIAELAGLNYAVIGEITGVVNANFRDVSVDEALANLLMGTRFAYLRRGGTVLFGDRNPNTPSGQALSGSEMVFLKYIKAENLEKLYPKSLSPENIKVVKEQNALLISGTADDVQQARDFVDKVDLPTPQVMLEVIIVEYTRDKSSDFGLAPGKSNDPGANLNMSGNLSGIDYSFQKGGFKGGVGILGPLFEMNLRALEARKKAKVLAMPKITTINGNKADLKVSRTNYYPVSSVTKDGFQNNDYRAIDDGITIELTPWVTRHGEVNVTINPSIKTTEPGRDGAPEPVTNRAIQTNVRLMDGETIALGGLIESKETNQRSFVPILGSIPVLGYLFSYRRLQKITTELVIYITPHILDPVNQGLNLEEEFHNMEKRGGFLKSSDFIRPDRSEKNNPPNPSVEAPETGSASSQNSETLSKPTSENSESPNPDPKMDPKMNPNTGPNSDPKTDPKPNSKSNPKNVGAQSDPGKNRP
jgi:type IV pilus assembly protein PilQ